MAMVDLKGVYKVTAKGRTYYYAWRNGPRIHADPNNPAAFGAELERHLVDRKAPDATRVRGLLAEWKSSPAWRLPPELGGMADSTKKNWRPWLVRIEERFGGLRVRVFDRSDIRRDIRVWLDTWETKPRTADFAKQVLSAALNFAVEQDYIRNNPCLGMRNRYESNRADIIWTAEDIVRLEAAASPEITWALKLAVLTGLRRGDLLRLSWNHIDDLAITISAGKSRRRGKGQLEVVIPLYAELRELLAQIPKRGPIVLTSTESRPWTANGFGSSWNKTMKRLGEGRLHFNDSRGTFATKVYAAGALKLPQIAQLLGWKEARVERIISRYVDRQAVLNDLIRKLDGNAG